MNTNQTNSNDRPGQLLKIGRRLFLAGVIASTFGCQNVIRRGQSTDEPLNVSKYENSILKSGPRSIGEIGGVAGLNSVKVFGVGLATGLKGTGSAPIESGPREHLQRELRLTNNVTEIKELMTDKNTELVIIEGRIPPGARAGDHFDLQVITMAESSGTSLQNGTILKSRLRRMARLGNRVKKGSVSAIGTGPLIVKSLINNSDEPQDALHAVIPAGGKTQNDRALALKLKENSFDHKTALQITHAINNRFRYRTSLGHDGVAEPKTDQSIELKIPLVYRNNVGRYASVLSQLYFSEKQSQLQERLASLEAQIGDPNQARLAAIQLEAIGNTAKPILQSALNHSDFEPRFYAAEALAYMGVSDGISELVTVAKTEQDYRWHAFAALAAMEGRESANVLSELFNEPEIEVRYGAFKAIRQQNEDDPIVVGDFLAEQFFLHEIDSTAEPTVHFSTQHRPEIVVFGSKSRLKDNFLFVESGLTIKSEGDDTLTLTAYSPDDGKQQRSCSNQVADLVRTLAELGYGYSMQLKVIRQASQNGALNAELVIDAAPKIKTTPRKPQRVASDFEDTKPESIASKFINFVKPAR